MKKKKNSIVFEERDCGYAAVNGKIDDHNIYLLENQYAGTGIFFENNDWENEATMNWSDSTDISKIAQAKLDFTNYIVPV